MVRSFPGVDGFILDGPEWGVRNRARPSGQSFSAATVTAAATGRPNGGTISIPSGKPRHASRTACGILEACHPAVGNAVWSTVSNALIANPGLFDWFRFKTDSIEHYVRAFADTARSLDPPRKIACGPRLPAFAPLTGYNFGRLAGIVDFQCPKLYFWQHGIDGLKGTLYRYGKTFCEWNPGMTEPEALDRRSRTLRTVGSGRRAPRRSGRGAASRVLRAGGPERDLQNEGTPGRRHPASGPGWGCITAGVRMDSRELEHLLLQTVEQGGLITLILLALQRHDGIGLAGDKGPDRSLSVRNADCSAWLLPFSLSRAAEYNRPAARCP